MCWATLKKWVKIRCLFFFLYWSVLPVLDNISFHSETDLDVMFLMVFSCQFRHISTILLAVPLSVFRNCLQTLIPAFFCFLMVSLSELKSHWEWNWQSAISFQWCFPVLQIFNEYKRFIVCHLLYKTNSYSALFIRAWYKHRLNNFVPSMVEKNSTRKNIAV